MNKAAVMIVALAAEVDALKQREANYLRALARIRTREWIAVLISLSVGAVIGAVSMYLVRLCP